MKQKFICMIKHSDSNKILEIDIKAIILEYLIAKSRLNENHSIISEFAVDRNSRRADLVIADDRRLTGFEIKSEADSLCRLTGQTEKYLDYFDKVIVVAAPKHISNIVKTTPKNVAIWEVSNKGIKITIIVNIYEGWSRKIPYINSVKRIIYSCLYCKNLSLCRIRHR